MRDALITILTATALLLCVSFVLHAQDTTRVHGEEIDITVTVQQHGSTTLPSVLVDNDVYLPVFDLFQFLRIRTLVSVSGDTLTGFFLSESVPYTIDFSEGRVQLDGRTFALERGDYIKTEMAVFLRRSAFARIFGLECSFDFRALLVDVRSRLELPLVRELQRERIRKSARRIGGVRSSDRQLRAGHTLFRPGVLDWGLSSRSATQRRTDWTAALAGGVGLFGGDAEINGVLRSDETPGIRNLFWQWRHVDNTHPLLRQFTVGRFGAVDAAGRPSTMTGFSLSNTPTTLRRAFGTYIVDGNTGAEWTVELYQNKMILDVAKADANGYYRFEVPLSYGTTTITLKFFGPWGEERTEERAINIPFTFLPQGEVEYTITGGLLDAERDTYAGTARVNIGTGRYLTFGAGTDYHIAHSETRFTPSFGASFRPVSEVLFRADYAHDLHTTALLSWTLPGRSALSIDWTHHAGNGRTGTGQSGELRRFMISTPVSSPLLQGNIRALFRQELTAGRTTYGAEAGLSGSVLGVRSNLAVLGDHLESSTRGISATLALAFELPYAVTLRPQVDMDIARGAVTAVRSGVERALGGAGWITASAGKDIRGNSWSGQLSLRYELPFAQTAFSVLREGARSTATTSARGSVAVDADHADAVADARSWLRRGGITVEAYLDVDGDGIRDANERSLRGIHVQSDGGRIQHAGADSLTRIVDLEAYRSYRIEVSPITFENVSWQIKDLSYDVDVLPNQFVTLAVPVFVAGEVSGRIIPDSTLQRRSLGGYTVRFLDSTGIEAARVLTEKDGSYYFLGLAPGTYTVELDPSQLERLHLRGTSASFVVAVSEDGAIVEHADVTLRREAVR